MIGPYSLIIVFLGVSSINAEELLMGTLVSEGNTKEEALRSVRLDSFPGHQLSVQEVKVKARKKQYYFSSHLDNYKII